MMVLEADDEDERNANRPYGLAAVGRAATSR
jgi:hypothetical protein